MALSKKDRQIVWNKSNGICWYCGCDLPEKGWHADHVEPIRRSEYQGVVTVSRPDLDVIDNIVPACAQCNNFKATWPLEWFRENLEQQVKRGRKYSTNFRNAERYGLITVHEKKIVFWFEREVLKDDRQKPRAAELQKN